VAFSSNPSTLIGDLGDVNLGFQYQAFGVHEEMTLPATHFLASVITALFSAYIGSLRGLGVHYPRAGLGVSPREFSLALAQRRV
jgi:hypothetical protein